MKNKDNIFEQYIESLPLFKTESERFEHQKNFMLNLSPKDLVNFLNLQQEAVFADLHNVLDNPTSSQKDIVEINLFVDKMQNAIVAPSSLKAA
jgi:hypothetical protein